MQTILFFDLDATLVENKFSRKAIGPLLQEIAEATGQSVDSILREFGAENTRRQQDDPDNVLTMDWQDILMQIAENYQVSLSDTIDNRWTMCAYAHDVDVLDNARSVLDTLKTKQRKIVLATKGLSKYQNPVLEVTGLKTYFDDILTPDITGYLKTSANYFDKYKDVDALKIQIGDHYYDDVICPKKRGYLSIMRAPIADLEAIAPFERPQHLVEFREQIHTYPKDGTDIVPDAVVVSLEELPEVIEKMEA